MRADHYSAVLRSRKASSTGALVAAASAAILIGTGAMYIMLGGALAPGIATAFLGALPGYVAKLFFTRAHKLEGDAEKVADKIDELLESPARLRRAVQIVRYMENGPMKESILAELGLKAANLDLGTLTKFDVRSLRQRSLMWPAELYDESSFDNKNADNER
ncbi:hypothetical protein [Amycolatopsis sp. NPDC004169]|uniref:hypothetical protein n=1 Tax=Amycolatopsis sp. NPDC004169 TaxID=3154453 RepID=UPI0033AFD047